MSQQLFLCWAFHRKARTFCKQGLLALHCEVCVPDRSKWADTCSCLAGHAGDVLDGKWYIVGGGNNSAACRDLVALNLAGLGGTPLVETPDLQWEALAETEASSSTSSEGLTLSSLPSLGLILAFGGYNGKYHSAVQIYRPGQLFRMAGQEVLAI